MRHVPAQPHTSCPVRAPTGPAPSCPHVVVGPHAPLVEREVAQRLAVHSLGGHVPAGGHELVDGDGAEDPGHGIDLGGGGSNPSHHNTSANTSAPIEGGAGTAGGRKVAGQQPPCPARANRSCQRRALWVRAPSQSLHSRSKARSTCRQRAGGGQRRGQQMGGTALGRQTNWLLAGGRCLMPCAHIRFV